MSYAKGQGSTGHQNSQHLTFISFVASQHGQGHSLVRQGLFPGGYQHYTGGYQHYTGGSLTHLSGRVCNTVGINTPAMALYRIESQTPTRLTMVGLSRMGMMCAGIPCQKCSRKLCTCKSQAKKSNSNYTQSQQHVSFMEKSKTPSYFGKKYDSGPCLNNNIFST